MILTHIKIPEPVNFVIAAILLHALTTLKYCAVSVLHRNLACQCLFPFLVSSFTCFSSRNRVFFCLSLNKFKKLKKILKNCLDEFSSKTACVTPQNWKKLNRYPWFLMDEFSSKTVCVTPQNCPIDDWMSFPVKRSRWRPGFFKNWIGTQDFLMDEFSSKTASEMSQKFANKG